MKFVLPCRFGDVFETAPDASGHTERLRLLGFDRGMQTKGVYSDPTIFAEPEHIPRRLDCINYTKLLRAGKCPAAYEVEIPDRLFDRHPLAEDGIRSKRSGELISVNLRSGRLLCRYF